VAPITNSAALVPVAEPKPADAAGKGGTTKRFMEHMTPRTAHVVALAKPNERERRPWYCQRSVAHLPAAGEMALFDRSWCSRARVERVMGFCSPTAWLEFMRQAPVVERMLTRSGIRLFKCRFAVSRAEQLARFKARDDGIIAGADPLIVGATARVIGRDAGILAKSVHPELKPTRQRFLQAGDGHFLDQHGRGVDRALEFQIVGRRDLLENRHDVPGNGDAADRLLDPAVADQEADGTAGIVTRDLVEA
jgi:hypothetical protein